jgi:hypothetical protein
MYIYATHTYQKDRRSREAQANEAALSLPPCPPPLSLPPQQLAQLASWELLVC